MLPTFVRLPACPLIFFLGWGFVEQPAWGSRGLQKIPCSLFTNVIYSMKLNNGICSFFLSYWYAGGARS